MSTADNFTIPWEKWNLLSEADISVLKSLGYSLAPEVPVHARTKGSKATRSTAPEEYILAVKIHCQFCGYTHWQYFAMLTERNYLKGVEISEEQFSFLKFEKRVTDRTDYQRPQTCHYCEDTLSRKSTNELVAIVISQRIKIKTGFYPAERRSS